MWSGIQSLDELRSKAAASGTGCISVSIEELNSVKDEVLNRIENRKITRQSKCLDKERDMINKPAFLYKDWQKKDEPEEVVTVLHIGTVADEDGSYIAASVERENGDVIEVGHDRLRFLNDPEISLYGCYCTDKDKEITALWESGKIPKA